MNQITTRPETSISSVGITTGAGGSSIAPQNLGEVVRFAEVMCKADIALPKHLRGNAGACMAVALQALQWEMNPFAVASKSYSVNGVIAYEAQLIAAVVNTRSGIKGRLKYEFIGEGDELTCRVSGILDDEECAYETPVFGAIHPKNSPLWKTDPRQQLGYYAARSWARRHCPEVLLGVYDRDEAAHFGPDNAKDVTSSVMQRLQDRQQRPQEVAQAREGFDESFVSRETDALSSAPADESEQPEESPPSGLGSSGGDPSNSPDSAAADLSAGAADHGEEGASETADGQTVAPSSPTLSDEDRQWLVKAARMLIPSAAPNGDPNVVRRQYSALIKTETPTSVSQLAIGKAVAISKRLVAVCECTEDLDLELLAGIAGCDVREIRP